MVSIMYLRNNQINHGKSLIQTIPYTMTSTWMGKSDRYWLYWIVWQLWLSRIHDVKTLRLDWDNMTYWYTWLGVLSVSKFQLLIGPSWFILCSHWLLPNSSKPTLKTKSWLYQPMRMQYFHHFTYYRLQNEYKLVPT